MNWLSCLRNYKPKVFLYIHVLVGTMSLVLVFDAQSKFTSLCNDLIRVMNYLAFDEFELLIYSLV